MTHAFPDVGSPGCCRVDAGSCSYVGPSKLCNFMSQSGVFFKPPISEPPWRSVAYAPDPGLHAALAVALVLWCSGYLKWSSLPASTSLTTPKGVK